MNMKTKILLMVLTALYLCGCKTKEKRQKPYTLTLFVMEYNRSGTPIYLNHKRETITAFNDTLAYNEALKAYYANKTEEAQLGTKSLNQTIKFEIKNGIRNLNEEFNTKLTDSLKKNYLKLNPGIKITQIDKGYHQS